MDAEKKNPGNAGGAVLRSVDDLKASPRNPRKISAEALAGLKVSIAQYGDIAGIVFNSRTGELVCGHQRVRALKSLYGEGLRLEGTRLVAPTGESWEVRLVEWDAAHSLGAMITANNEHIQGEFTDDVEKLLAELKGTDEELFAGLELDRLFADFDAGALRGECDPDEGPDAPPPVTKPGDLWELGEHLLLCGDSTKADDVRRVMRGERSALFATDPPYLVDYDGSNHYGGPKDHSADYGITWDDSSQSGTLYEGFCGAAIAEAIREDAAWYCWHASRRQALLEAVWAKLGILVHQQIIWAKDRPVLTHGAYLWGHEPCLFGWKRGNQPRWLNDEKPSTVWRIESVRQSLAKLHPTPKPIEVFALPIRQHTVRGDVCFEPFAGSGSQVLAAESLGRRCRAIEIHPAYCDLVVARFAKYTGRTHVVLNGVEVDWRALAAHGRTEQS